MFCIKCGKQLSADARFCSACGSKVSDTDNFETGYNYAEKYAGLYDDEEDYKESEEKVNPSNAGLTLVEFRQNAPFMEGYREELLVFRKSLSNSWDYNAYVGILLGVGGSKHGDAACMNFAIGQGDNGNNVKKTLEAKGLMPLFEKYKGKKIDGSILLSDVEDEILGIAPEYASIRQKLSRILNGKSDNISTPVEVRVKPTKTVQTVSKVKSVVAEPKKVKPAPVKETMFEKYKKLPCHEVAYSFVSRVGVPHLQKSKGYFSTSGLVVEYEQDLYYFKNTTNAVELRKIPLRGNGSQSIIMSFDGGRKVDDGYGDCYGYDDTFYLGNCPVFCIQNKKIYFSFPQCMGVQTDEKYIIENNEIWSMDISNPSNYRKEFELTSGAKRMLYSPYVIGDKVLVSAYAGSGDELRYLLDKDGNEKIVNKYSMRQDYQYLSINEDGFVVDCDANTAVYDFCSEAKTSIKKAYKKSKYESFLFLDAKRDIFYYLEDERNIFGEIIGISKSGEVVDKWDAVVDLELLKLNNMSKGCNFSFDGNLRVYAVKVDFCSEIEIRGDYIYAVDRTGNGDKRFEYKHSNGWADAFLSAGGPFIQTPNAIIVGCKDKSRSNEIGEYMITTTGEKNCKPLFD